MEEFVYKPAINQVDFNQAKSLLVEYTEELDFEIDFQDFETELLQLAQQYAPPSGALILAFDEAEPIGCIALRNLDTDITELKRMYVKPLYRNRKIGAQLLKMILEDAKKRGYEKVRLDTMKRMARAMEIYKAFGFYQIDPYRYNPLEDAVYMEKTL